MAVLAILAYGTLVKFQAFFLAPLILLWVAYEKSKPFQIKKYIPSLFIIGSLFYGMFYGIQFSGPKVQPDHSWQYVKFFDLAAISVDLNENLIPKANQKENFSFDTMKQILRPNRVDDLIFGEGSILKKGNSDHERSELYNTWLKEVTAHPFLYLKHRTFNMAYILLSIPEFEAIQSGISSIKILSENLEKYSHIFARVVGLIFIAHFLTMCTGLFYFFFALITWIKRKTPAAIPLFFLNATVLSMVAVIFFCSMAGTPRYTYISVLLIHASHFFAYMCWKNRKEKYVSIIS